MPRYFSNKVNKRKYAGAPCKRNINLFKLYVKALTEGTLNFKLLSLFKESETYTLILLIILNCEV